MTKWILAAGAAALAIAAPALAQPGGGHGGGPGGGHGGGPGGGHAQARPDHEAKGGAMKIERARSGPQMQAQHSGRGADIKAARIERGPAMKAERANVSHAARQEESNSKRDVRIADRGFEPRFGTQGLANGLIDGCPPGLAAKHNGCLPPGQAKKLVGTTLPNTLAQSLLSGPYRSWYPDDDRYTYRMGDDYIYRVNRSSNLIDALIPAVDRNFSYYPVGQMYPSDFNFYNVPTQYQSYYPDGGNMLYRYGDGAIYGLNPQTQAVQSIVALLAGDLGVGQPLPTGYSAYNVPLQYRSQYYDTPNDIYRYNDGYIYRADPKTQLITAVIRALV